MPGSPTDPEDGPGSPHALAWPADKRYVLVDVGYWWDHTHYTARVIAIRPTEEEAVEAMWEHARATAEDPADLDIDDPDEWERDEMGLTVTRDGRDAYRIERPWGIDAGR